jgi:chemotaxis protein methyltransferase CheR
MTVVDIEDEELCAITEIVHSEAGILLGESKRALVAARLGSRLRALGCESFAQYCEHLATGDPEGIELRRMINRLTTNKTSFFREPHHFDFLRERLIHRLASTEQRKLRIWSAGCSTGQEPYSLAMLLGSDPRLSDWDIRILASDIDTEVLEQAGTAEYSAAQTGSIPPPMRADCFELRGTTLRVSQRIRDLVTFRRINLIEEPWPIHASFDAIFCRNVTIYFDVPTRARLYQRFAQQLRPHGHLFIGHSEHLHGMKETFTAVGGTVYCLTSFCDAGGRPPGGSWRPPLRSGPPQRLSLFPRRAAQPAVALPPRASLSTPDASGAPPPTPSRQVRVGRGDIFASNEPSVAELALGASVAVCLFDPGSKTGGVCRFLLPEGDAEEQRDSNGWQAIEALLAAAAEREAVQSRLIAKIFGGGRADADLDGPECARAAPERSVEFARRELGERGIPVVAERVGGDRRILLRFEPHTGRAFVRVLGEAEGEG